MTSRPFGPEGKVAGNLKPTAIYGAGWATLALLRSMDAAPLPTAGTR